MAIFIAFVIGFASAFVCLTVMRKVRTAGILWVGSTGWIDNPDIFLELFRSVKALSRSQYVTLKVRVKGIDPQE